MNFNIDNINQLVSDFVELDEKNQKKILGQIFNLQQEQTIKEENKDNPEMKKDEDLFVSRILAKKLEDVKDFAKKTSELDNERKAKTIVAMEAIRPGSFTKKDEIKILIETKHYTIKEIIENQYPEIDANKVIKETMELLPKK